MGHPPPAPCPRAAVLRCTKGGGPPPQAAAAAAAGRGPACVAAQLAVAGGGGRQLGGGRVVRGQFEAADLTPRTVLAGEEGWGGEASMPPPLLPCLVCPGTPGGAGGGEERAGACCCRAAGPPLSLSALGGVRVIATPAAARQLPSQEPGQPCTTEDRPSSPPWALAGEGGCREEVGVEHLLPPGLPHSPPPLRPPLPTPSMPLLLLGLAGGGQGRRWAADGVRTMLGGARPGRSGGEGGLGGAWKSVPRAAGGVRERGESGGCSDEACW
ncbi:hypothetical protein V8C86DRAFT_2545401 [Haematococcus lacustris]